ncbi:hypothetical protein [Geomonas agri]|uniref:hypothetical protein n=1 Tax=Geomonas agri TaxID=2873702 RepID=UPI001CD6DF3B|nr:hypothetical protein [Geomonas agri]
MRIFDAVSPRFITPDASVTKLVSQRPELLDDQLLIFFGPKFNLTSGILSGPSDEVIYGGYRIQRCYIEGENSWRQAVIEPYPEDWAIFPPNQVKRPWFGGTIPGINYFKPMGISAILDAVREAEKVARADTAWTEHLKLRVLRFSDQIEHWLAIAEKQLQSLTPYQPETEPPKTYHFGNEGFGSPFAAKLKGVKFPTQEVSVPVSDRALPATSAEFEESISGAVAVTSPDVDASYDQPSDSASPEHDLLSTACRFNVANSFMPEDSEAENIAQEYGESIVKALRVASISKPLLILTGPPGVGKSRLAGRLIDDGNRERSIVVPVSSTWRGREDLLGYVNPVTQGFVPTSFTLFVKRAEDAWRSGDTRLYLAIFEEFNLSQPEHWLSDFLVRLEYDPDDHNDRTIDLGASFMYGLNNSMSSSSLYLPPNLKFVATINNDHTVRPLSARILDRSALIEVSASGKDAMKRAGIDDINQIGDIVEDLNYRIESHGVAFSVRTACSLSMVVRHLQGMDPMDALDHVLVQGVLSKLRLHAGDPGDELLLHRLQEWIARPACAPLVLCSERITAWDEARRQGRDVFQA